MASDDAERYAAQVHAATLALLLLGRRAYRNPQLRRTIGILWDLATFWPRASHPLAPPCYCERALPDLICRIRAAAPTGDRRVVLSAHSQGTVIAAALVLQLEDDERDRIRLVTIAAPGDGPPPAVWRWRNLYRRTDPIGGWAVADQPPDRRDEVDWQLVDPAFDPPAGDTRPPAIHGHSGYLDDPAYAAAVTTVLKG